MAGGIKAFLKNVFKDLTTNLGKNLREGFRKLYKWPTEAVSAAELQRKQLKFIKNVVKMGNGLYDMFRINNFGKTEGKAALDFIKAGKDTWDTIVKTSFDEISYPMKLGKDKVKLSDLYFSAMKYSVSGANKVYSVINHKNLNLNTFEYDSKISKQTDKSWKGFTTFGSPSKMISALGEWIGADKLSIPEPVKTGFSIWLGSHTPILGSPIFTVTAFSGGL